MLLTFHGSQSPDFYPITNFMDNGLCFVKLFKTPGIFLFLRCANSVFYCIFFIQDLVHKYA